jgi:hypothetical protein
MTRVGLPLERVDAVDVGVSGDVDLVEAVVEGEDTFGVPAHLSVR